MGNCRTHDEFFAHYRFAIAEMFRVTMPGRLASVHCMNLPTSKVRDGVIGLQPTSVVRSFARTRTRDGSITAKCIWKDPVTAMQRTKALGLFYKQIKKDSDESARHPRLSRHVPQTGREPRTRHQDARRVPVQLWQQYASPVWMDINPSDTLQYRSAREHDDERHICPLQLDVIRRAVRLWSNPDDLVLSPFAGIASEGVVAIEEGRRFVGVELKGSYYQQAARNLGERARVAGYGSVRAGRCRMTRLMHAFTLCAVVALAVVRAEVRAWGSGESRRLLLGHRWFLTRRRMDGMVDRVLLGDRPVRLRVLAHHWPDVPNLGDITRIDWTAVEPVDVVDGRVPASRTRWPASGWPSDSRDLFGEIIRAVRVLRPQYLVLENVRGLLYFRVWTILRTCSRVAGRVRVRCGMACALRGRCRRVPPKRANLDCGLLRT